MMVLFSAVLVIYNAPILLTLYAGVNSIMLQTDQLHQVGTLLRIFFKGVFYMWAFSADKSTKRRDLLSWERRVLVYCLIMKIIFV